ncbi:MULTISPECIES: MFS transporter [unclassified Rhodosalinus]|uniref:MFS transporter n=1 Tax=unclassified Rhodosalinus TaxID=2630183 RepID=UPI003524DAF1
MPALRDLALTRAPSAAFAAMALFWGMLAALMPQIKTRAGASDAELGLLLLLATCGAGVAVLLAGPLERALAGRAAALSALAMAVALALLGAADTRLLFGVALFVGGTASGLMDVTVNVRIARTEAGTGRGLMNLVHGIYAVALALAAFSAGLAREGGVPLPVILWVAALLVLPLALACAGADPDARPEPAAVGRPPAGAGALVAAGGAVILVGFIAEQASDGWSALHLERSAGAGPAAAALGPVILSLATGVGRLSAQAVLGRVGEAALLRWAAGFAAAGAGLAAWAPGLGWAYLGFAAMGLGVSVIVPLALALVGRGAGERRMRAISLASAIGYTGFFLGPPAMGFLSEWQGLWLSFLAVAGALALIPLALGPWLAASTRRSG